MPTKPTNTKKPIGETPKAKTGRPRKEIDLDLIEKLATIHCTIEEISAIVGCNPDTIYARMKEDESFSELIEKARSNGKASLRRLQWAAAQKGDRTMLVWLGKQLLGQRDFNRWEVANAPGETFKTETTDLKALSDDDLKNLEAILSKTTSTAEPKTDDE